MFPYSSSEIILILFIPSLISFFAPPSYFPPYLLLFYYSIFTINSLYDQLFLLFSKASQILTLY